MSIELGLVPIDQAPVPGVATDLHHHRYMALRVSDANGRGRAEVEQCLRRGGFAVVGDRRLARNASGISAATELGITPRQLEVLEVLARCDHTDEMARTLGVTVATVEDHLQRLKDMLEVCSRARLLGLAIERGLLILEPSSYTWPRHARIRSSS
jgi:DNA-binding CsgD family transcriptional regulator